jgi:peptide/nickel transport system permease protein
LHQNGLLWFVFRRLGTVVLTLLGLVTIVFVMVKSIPGDEAQVAAGAGATPQQVEQVRQELGLDQPVAIQYARYLGNLLRGNLGTSSVSHRPVLSDIGGVLPASLQLVSLALILALGVSIPAASIAAVRRGHGSDTTSRILVIVVAGLPAFWLALVLQWMLGSQRILPISGSLSIGLNVPRWSGMTVVDSALTGSPGTFLDAVQHMVLPAAILAIHAGAQFYRFLRAEMLSVLQREHIMVARAKGASTRRIVTMHALPNAFGPVLTQIGVQIGVLVASAVVVESIFGLPGIGSYMFYAVEQRDIYAVLGAVLTVGIIVVVANFVVDLLQLARDPRIRAAQLGS